MSFTLPPLPFATNALEGVGMGTETLELHHGKHHQAYVTALNGFVEKNDALKDKTLEEIVLFAKDKADLAPVFNNAGQHWNHNLFWQNLSATGGRLPGSLEKKIVEDFGNVDQFKEAFKTAAVGQFGSGWAWLVLANDGKLKVTSTPNQDNPLMDVAEKTGTPILGNDVWEHAYYLTYQNRRPEYLSAWWDVVDWGKVSERYAAALAD